MVPILNFLVSNQKLPIRSAWDHQVHRRELQEERSKCSILSFQMLCSVIRVIKSNYEYKLIIWHHTGLFLADTNTLVESLIGILKGEHYKYNKETYFLWRILPHKRDLCYLETSITTDQRRWPNVPWHISGTGHNLIIIKESTTRQVSCVSRQFSANPNVTFSGF